MAKIGIKVNKISFFQFIATLPIFSTHIFMPSKEEVAEDFSIFLPVVVVVSVVNIFNLIASPVWIYKKLGLIM